MWSSVIVDDDRHGEVEADGERVHKNEGLGEFAGVFELGDQGEERYMTGWRVLLVSSDSVRQQ